MITYDRDKIEIAAKKQFLYHNDESSWNSLSPSKKDDWYRMTWIAIQSYCNEKEKYENS